MARPEDKTILIVDDEEDAREYLATVLEDAGFNVVLAIDGNDALAKVQQKEPDFISLDLVMPGKSGIRFLHELRRSRTWAKIPFVIVTAHAGDEEIKDDLHNIMAGKTFSGPGLYLEKPVNAERYVRFVCEQVGLEYTEPESGTDSNALRLELQALLNHADDEVLRATIHSLKKSRQS